MLRGEVCVGPLQINGDCPHLFKWGQSPFICAIKYDVVSICIYASVAFGTVHRIVGTVASECLFSFKAARPPIVSVDAIAQPVDARQIAAIRRCANKGRS